MRPVRLRPICCGALINLLHRLQSFLNPRGLDRQLAIALLSQALAARSISLAVVGVSNLLVSRRRHEEVQVFGLDSLAGRGPPTFLLSTAARLLLLLLGHTSSAADLRCTNNLPSHFNENKYFK